MNDVQQTIVYENAFSGSQKDWLVEMKKDWLLEGKGVVECGSDHLSMRSTIFTVPRHADGHFNLWLRREFPKNFACEWDFRYSQPGEAGLAIFMWAARGRNGTDIFDASLPERKGEEMADMHSGAINCYHTSYIARDRKTANLRKNYGFHLLCSGEDLSQSCPPEVWHRIRVEQIDDLVTLSYNGQIAYQHRDLGAIGGPPIRTGGAIGFRQQNNLYRGDYRHLTVYSLE